jgi:division protein CdvB (Snf7/Vps24/ESCRT-III family)
MKPLKQFLEEVEKKINEQIPKLDQAVEKLEKHEREVFQKAVEYLEKDPVRASLYINECGEIRKIIKNLIVARVLLNQTLTRLQSIETTTDLIVEGSLTIQLLSEVRTQLGGIIPEISYEIHRSMEQLQKIVTELQEATGFKPNKEGFKGLTSPLG